uniref:Uncharacterized protein n=1 Tax=Anguilla anguilla TaxID=7936 RepID=A0A0E9U663_ANGAN
MGKYMWGWLKGFKNNLTIDSTVIKSWWKSHVDP